jgi:hypothetical protein
MQARLVFRARHSVTLQCMRLTDHVTLNITTNMSTAAIFLDIEKVMFFPFFYDMERNKWIRMKCLPNYT